MYQLPVTKLETIRKSRKKVKRILSDIGLQYCKELLEEFKSCHPGDYYMKNTSWTDFSIWHPSKKSKAYRAKPFCCSLCNFSTKYMSAYKSHMRCFHEDEMDMEMLVSCPNCVYIAHPEHMRKHAKIFHVDTRKVHNIGNNVNPDQGRLMQPKIYQCKISNVVQPVYFCRVCSYKDASLYGIKKHVFLSHFNSLVNAYIGKVKDQVEVSIYKYFCKGCQMKIVTYDALLYHILDKHREVEGPVRATIGHVTELKPRAHIVPKPQISNTSLPVPLSVNSAVSSCNVRLTGQMLPCVKTAPLAPNIRPIGPVLSSVKSAVSTTNIKQSLPVISTVQSPITTPVQQSLNVLALPQNFSPVSLGSRPAINAFPLQGKLIPVTVATTGPGGAPKPGHVNLVPATFQVGQNNLAIRAVGPVLPQAFLMPQGLAIDQTIRPNLPGNVLSANSQTVKHLIQNNKPINGVPAYTLTPVHFSSPVASAATTSNKPGVLSTTQMPLNVAQTNNMTSGSQQLLKKPSVITGAPMEQKQSPPMAAITQSLTAQTTKAQQWKSCSMCSALLPLSAYDHHIATAHKAEEPNDKPEKIIACATYLQRVRAHICKCLFCRRYVHNNILLSHLLMHGLTCLFCSLTFHDLSTLTEHVKASHARLTFETVKDGVSTTNQINDGIFNLTVKLPIAKMGPNDIHLTLIPNKMSSPRAPLVIEVRRQKMEENEEVEVEVEVMEDGVEVMEDEVEVMEEEVEVMEDEEEMKEDEKEEVILKPLTEEPLSSKCPFCSKSFSSLKYEAHLQERHHVASMLHPLLKIPSFKCIHCHGMYIEGMAPSTISLHLLRCRGLNKQQGNSLPKNTVKSKRAFSDVQKSATELVSNGEGKKLAMSPPKRLKTDVLAINYEVSDLTLNDAANTSHSLPSQDPSTVLALVPNGFENHSYEERKLFLLDYFHKQPYPSNKEIEMLSSILWLWKNDVALVFSTKQRLCLKAMRYKPFVLLGFNMSELKKVNHNLTLGQT
ncbi:activity-dependent neuroprotector homeobox protein 2-like isoform X2 [Narcine bancroftii]|uniref:activity-dependent neuroprotector homeobox protein 2-like isoform X2 n=1 Tax=Narcine bancroftii TaxID=1343680 RepID=UPI0038316957